MVNVKMAKPRIIRAAANLGKWSLNFGRRHYLLFIVLMVLIAVRVALPFILRPVLAEQASKAIHARVGIGQVQLWLIKGAAAVKDVKVFTPSQKGPIIAWDALYGRIDWFDLFKHSLHFDEIRLESPDIDVNRLKNGELNILGLLPGQARPSTPAKSESPWTLAVDRLILLGGNIDFRDFKVGSPGPIEFEINQFQVTRFSFQHPQYNVPARAELDAHIEGAPVQFKGSLRYLKKGLSLTASLKGEHLPLRYARLYVPQPGWTRLRGKLDMSLDYRLETGVQDELRGHLAVRDLTVQAEGIDQPALQWTSLSIDMDPLDLMARQAAVKNLDLQGASVPLRLRPGGAAVIPLLGPKPAVGQTLSSAKSSPQNTGKSLATPSNPAKTNASPWRWTLAQLAVQNSHIIVLSQAPTLDIGVRVKGQNLGSGDNRESPVEIQLNQDNASLNAQGKLRLHPFGFSGQINWKELPLSRLLATAGKADLAKLIHTGHSDGELNIAMGSELVSGTGGENSPGAAAVQAKGRVEVADLLLAGPDPERFSVQWKTLDVEIGQISRPAALSPGKPEKAGGPLVVQIDRIDLHQPTFQLTRTAQGLILPISLGSSKSAAAPPSAPSSIHMKTAALNVENGQLLFTDRQVKPFFRGQFSAIKLNMDTLSWPRLNIDQLSLQMTGPGGGHIEADGKVDSSGIHVEVNGKQINLLPFNPYVTTYSHYSINQGQLGLNSTIRVARGAYNSDNQLTLQDLQMAGKQGEDLFQQQFGIPLSLAMALMRNLNGNIDLNLSIGGDLKGIRVRLFDTVASAFRDAILNAIVSPLKLLGLLRLHGDKVATFRVEPISFAPAETVVTSQGERQIQKLASVLAQHPGLAVALQGMVGSADVRRLREQDLLAELKKSPPASLSESQASAIQDYLETRTVGETMQLPEATKTALNKLLAQIEITSKRLVQLGNQRSEQVRGILEKQYGIPAQRVTLQTAKGQASQGKAAVHVEIHPLS